jgi:hypothetical protein
MASSTLEDATMAKGDEAQYELADVPPHDFVKARNALVARLQKDGDTAAAKAVAAMKRPPVTVWAVNRLSRDASDTVEELIESADRMKQAQLGHGGAATDLGAATARHLSVLGKLARRAETMLGSAGIRSSGELLRRIETTLTAAASDKDLRAALRKGRIEQELAPLGFEVFGGALPARRPADAGNSSSTSERRLSVVRPEPAKRATPDRAEARSEARVAAAEEAKRQREAARAEAARRRADAEAEIERLRQDVRAASTEVSQANEQLKQSTAAVRAARLAEKAARDALDAALRRARQRDT